MGNCQLDAGLEIARSLNRFKSIYKGAELDEKLDYMWPIYFCPKLKLCSKICLLNSPICFFV